MNSAEWRATAALSVIYGLRMLGMFMILPVFAVYASTLPGGASGWQIGLAVGVYGLTQALLQMPFGALSDRIGRKPVIVGGLLVFALGSLVAGLADTIGWIIAGRALQGGGAISAAVTALLADATRETHRTTAMAVFGAGMGASFVLALMLGPSVSGWIGVDGIFLATAVMALLVLPLVIWGVPPVPAQPRPVGPVKAVIVQPRLLELYAGIFTVHAGLTALFLAVPFALRQTLHLPVQQHWQVYLPVMLLSLVPVFPLVRRADRTDGVPSLMRLAAVGQVLAAVLAAVGHATVSGLLGAIALYFVAFNVLEAALPSRLSRLAPAAWRGSAMGVFSTMQFLGAFAGGLLGGVLLDGFGITGVFAACALLPLGWLGLSVALRAHGAADVSTVSK